MKARKTEKHKEVHKGACAEAALLKVDRSCCLFQTKLLAMYPPDMMLFREQL